MSDPTRQVGGDRSQLVEIDGDTAIFHASQNSDKRKLDVAVESGQACVGEFRIKCGREAIDHHRRQCQHLFIGPGIKRQLTGAAEVGGIDFRQIPPSHRGEVIVAQRCIEQVAGNTDIPIGDHGFDADGKALA